VLLFRYGAQASMLSLANLVHLPDIGLKIYGFD
jgi:hypothetical protein